jgi:hypothetical protein
MDEMGTFTFYGKVYSAACTVTSSRKDKIGNSGEIDCNSLKDIKREGDER